MEQSACPICLDPLVGSITTIGCCQQAMHLECIVKCMKQSLNCPLCRATHDGLRMVQDVESQVLVPVDLRFRRNTFIRDFFLMGITTSVIIVSFYRF